MLTTETSLSDHLQKFFGFNNFKGHQEAVIKNVLAGNDTFVIMPTGGGKSLCYQLPAMMQEGTAIIISPLIALMKNQVDAMRGYSENKSVAHYLNSSLNKTEIALVKSDVASGKTKLLYVAPESLGKEDNIRFLSSIKISLFAIDEAHCISEWGHDFRPEYRKLRPMIQRIGNVPLLALTATATLKVQKDIQKNLGMDAAKTYKSSFNRENLYYEVRPKTAVVKEIIKYTKLHSGKSGIIYCLSRKKVEEIAQVLQINGVKALAYHAGMDAGTRARHQDMFLMEDIDVIVATIAFGMGIDKPDVRYVIHNNIPKSLEGYYQETGRAGRDGGEGNCIAFYSYKDIEKLEKFMKDKPVAEQEIGRQLLAETVSYTESGICRRKQLLHYFGETYTQDNCGNCDNCNNPKSEIAAEKGIIQFISTIIEAKEKFKLDHIVNVLMGESTDVIKNYKHENLTNFGIGSDEDDSYWNAIARQCIISDLLKKDIESYGILKVTDKGRSFIAAPHPVKIYRDHNFEVVEESQESILNEKAKVGGAYDLELFDILKDLRKTISKQKNLPPFIIFQDPSLEEMTCQYPTTIEELKQINGVGTGKAIKFGQLFIDEINDYIEKNNIVRAQDMVIRSAVNKSANKVFIIQNIDKKLPLEDIAHSKQLSVERLIEEIEAIVSSGTKVNINYYINDEIDSDKQEEIYEYFQEAETDSVQEALDELGEDDYTEEEIRLVRIKFLSEFGN